MRLVEQQMRVTRCLLGGYRPGITGSFCEGTVSGEAAGGTYGCRQTGLQEKNG